MSWARFAGVKSAPACSVAPDGFEVTDTSAQVVELAEDTVAAKKPHDARAPVDQRVHAHGQCRRPQALLLGETRERASDLACDQRALVGAVGIEEGDEDDTALEVCCAHGPAADDVSEREVGQADAGWRLAAPVRTGRGTLGR